MNPAFLRLAWCGLHPERVGRLIDRHGVEGTVAGIARGHIEAPQPARLAVRRPFEELEAELAELGVRFVRRGEAGYPAGLVELPDAPPWLFIRGEVPDRVGVAVVGSRRATRYGLGIAGRLGRQVGVAGWPVVSGLAAGVDGAAHRGCIDGGGTGVAVLGSGIDVWYPARHRALGEELLAGGGAVISEFPPGTPPEAWRFPCRNRIISGLAQVVVVVEAAVRSGALITARLALEQGREVFAVPGDIDRATSAGCNLLIRDGAHPLVELDEVVGLLELVMGPSPRHGPEPEGVLDGLIGAMPISLDELAEQAGRPLPELLVEVARLEIAGKVTVEDGQVRASPG